MEYQELLGQLVEFVQEVAPMVWRIAMKQVMVEAVQWGMAAVFSLMVVAVLVLVARYFYKKCNEDNEDIENVLFPSALAVILFAFSLFFVAEVVGRLINPEFYAIQLLLGFAQ